MLAAEGVINYNILLIYGAIVFALMMWLFALPIKDHILSADKPELGFKIKFGTGVYRVVLLLWFVLTLLCPFMILWIWLKVVF